MNTATHVLTARAQAHRAACRDLANDFLVQTMLAARNPQPAEPMVSPMLPGWNLRRQAE